MTTDFSNHGVKRAVFPRERARGSFPLTLLRGKTFVTEVDNLNRVVAFALYIT